MVHRESLSSKLCHQARVGNSAETDMRYEARKLSTGWCVWNRDIDTPAVLDERWLVSLDIQEAYILTRVLNVFDSRKSPENNGEE